MRNLPYLLLEPFQWWLYKAPKRIFVVLKRILVFLNHIASFTLNIRLLFVPLFGDYTLPGRIIGFIIRVCQVILGSFLLILLLLLMLLAPLFWFIFPLYVADSLKFYSLFVFLAVYFGRLFLVSDTPPQRVGLSKSGDFISVIRLSVLKKLKSTVGSNSLDSIVGTKEIRHLLTKAELDSSEFREKISPLLSDLEIWKVLKKAYDVAQENGTRYIEIEHVFYALLLSNAQIEDLLLSFGTRLDDIKEAVFWVLNEKERLSRVFFWQEDYHLDKMGGFGRGMTGRVTPTLDSVSTDFTQLAKKGLIRGIVAHRKEIKEITDLLSGSQKVNILIIGQPGSGKTSIVKGIAKSIVEGTDYEKIRNKRIVSVESGSLVAGAKSFGDIAEKFKRVMNDVLGSGGIIMFFDEIHNLVSGVSDESSDVSSVYSILEPYLSTGKVQVLAATNRETYRKYIEPNGAFARLFQIVDIEPPTLEETKDILKHLAFDIEKFDGVLITLPAIEKVINLSEKLILDRVFPDKAVDILNRCVQTVARESRVVTAEIVAKVISDITNVPVTAVSDDESAKLLNIEQAMKARIVGQDFAIEQVAKALKRARTGIRDEGKPITSFLFVGSTGVGKTETAKTLSREYFGAESKMIRLDMSEYQQPDSISRLLGSSDGSTKGILTEAVKANPFSVVLLDEIEKANSRILLTFLQVLDDGRLTDSSGMTVSFTNTIIIATSNIGTREIQLVVQRNGSFSEMEGAVLQKVRDHYAPEFLNRLNGIIVFNPLTKEDVKKIARILLGKVEKMAKEKDIKITFTDDLLEKLVEKGYSPEWGARPLVRVIEDKVETYLAERILSQEIKRGDSIELTSSVF